MDQKNDGKVVQDTVAQPVTETVYVQQVEAPKKKSKVGIVLLVLFLVVFACCGLGGFGFYWGMSKVLDEAKQINSSVMTNLCEGLQSGDAEELFSDEFVANNDVDALVEKAFGSYEDCDSLAVGSVMELFQAGHSIDVQNVNGVVTAEYSFTNPDSVRVTMTLSQEDGKWLITDMSFTESY